MLRTCEFLAGVTCPDKSAASHVSLKFTEDSSSGKSFCDMLARFFSVLEEQYVP